MNELADWTKRDNFSREAHQRIISRVNALSGTVDAEIGADRWQRDEPRIQSPGPLIVRIHGNVILHAGGAHGPVEWLYDCAPQIFDPTAPTPWVDDPNASRFFAPNFIEHGNHLAPDGLWHNGVNAANLPTSFRLQPIPNETRLVAHPVYRNPTTHLLLYWLQYENAVDGICPEP
jgi:hypothetical protein